MAFFGNLVTLGTAEDARVCVRMAIDMQRHLAELEQEWRARGIEQPFHVRLGINKYRILHCGQFRGRIPDRVYLIRAEANLDTRMKNIANPPSCILMCHDAHVLVSGPGANRARRKPCPVQRHRTQGDPLQACKIDMSLSHIPKVPARQRVSQVA
ncbi:MAG: hypothetical protein GDA36_04335 [Rhodobacteraceae bacterium]|nr:hypothetical protein [Paracoccaceae bacterium]